jgi:hypothetical protein
VAADLGNGRAAVAACLLERESLTRWLQAPFPSRSKARKVYRSLLDVQLPFPLDDCAVAFLETARRKGENAEALAVVARAAHVEKRVAFLKGRGADPTVLDQEALALWTQSLLEMPGEPVKRGASANPPVRVVVYAAPDRVTVAAGRGNRFEAAHTARPTAADEVGRFVLTRMAPDAGPVQWHWCGPIAENGSDVERLQRDLATSWPGAFRIHRDPGAFLARALATRALGAGLLRCNLRTGRFAHPLWVRQAERRAAVTALLLLLGGSLLCGVNIAWRVSLERQSARTQEAIRQLAGTLSGVTQPPRGAEVVVAQRAMERELASMAPFRRAFAPSLMATLRAILETAAQSGISCDTISIRENSVSIRGVADDWTQCERLSNRLTGMGYRIKMERKGDLAAEKVRFSIDPAGSAAPKR